MDNLDNESIENVNKSLDIDNSDNLLSEKDKQEELKKGLETFMKNLSTEKPNKLEKDSFDYYNLTFDVIDTILHQHQPTQHQTLRGW